MTEKIIEKEEIEKILGKYNIGKKPLSLVLGWGEITIIRYLSGSTPDKFHSDILYRIKEDPEELLKYVEKNKNLITNIAYKKVIGSITKMKLEEDKSNIYVISKHIIAKTEDITPLALQKILYYIEGFALALLKKEIISSPCEAWVHGPVYRDIYERFSYYTYHPIKKENFKEYISLKALSQVEIELIDKVIDCFGCYSGKILEEMTHKSSPWLKARDGMDDKESSNRIIEKQEIKHFFKNVCQSYRISSIQDLSKYPTDMFQKIKEQENARIKNTG